MNWSRMHPYWQKQTADKPLFPDLLWSRPENKAQAGKLLIIGGNSHAFAAPGIAYVEAGSGGVGLTRVVLPHHVKRLLPRDIFKAGELEFAPGNQSGSFARTALAEMLEFAIWANGVLLAGDLGRNSETAIVLEGFVNKHSGQLTITQDAVDYFQNSAETILNRPDTLLVLSFAQLQKLASNVGFKNAFLFEMDFVKLIENLHEFTKQYAASIIVSHNHNVFVAVDGRVSTTTSEDENLVWRVKTATHAAVWWLQNTSKPFEAITSSLIKLKP